MSLAIAQIKPVLADPQKNMETMLALIASAVDQGAKTIIFPEMSLSGPLFDELAFCDALLDDCQRASRQIAQTAKDIKVIFGSLIKKDDQVYSCIYLAYQSRLQLIGLANCGKHLANSYAPAYLSGDEGLIELEIDGETKKVLIMLGNWQGKQMPDIAQGAQLLLFLSPSPLILPLAKSIPAWDKRSIQLNSIGLFASGKTNYLFAGHSAYYDETGTLLAAAPYFSEGLYIWHWQEQPSDEIRQEDRLLAEALIEGVRHFHLDINVKRAVIAVSGGIDSALAACIYREALGPDNVFLLTMPSQFNSAPTKSLAAKMADGLELPFLTQSINDSVEQLHHSLEINPFIDREGRKTTIQLSGYAKENIMARERTRYLAAIAAAMDATFSCNGNKAELAVGYATYYGDLTGAFAAQADLWKYQVYAAAIWFQSIFPDAPLNEIAAIRPSAELSPSQDVTKDLGDPLIYAYHDYLLKSWVEDDKCPADTLKAYSNGCLEDEIGCERGIVEEIFTGSVDFIADIERWWKMYRGIGVAKRLQAPPLLGLSKKPFGEPKPQVQNAVLFDTEFEQLKRKLVSP